MNMATGAMTSLLPKLGDLLNEKYKLRRSIREDVEFLSREMNGIQDVLLKVAEVRRDHLDKQVKRWADRFRELSYEMEVLVDELLHTTDPGGFKGLMERMGSLLREGKTRHEIIASTIKHIKAEVRILADRGNRYRTYDIVVNPAAMTSGDLSLSHQNTRGEDLVGQRDQELMKILSDGDVSNSKLKIVSVVGFGGSGKTTLVQTVYEKIELDFDCAAFVVAGQNPDWKKVLTAIISQLTVDYLNTLDEQQLIEKLQEILKNTRYLIVIDDMWNDNLWEDIKDVFSNESNLGSRIITTTRIISVSEACCSSTNDSIYQMKPLSGDDCKSLLHSRIFGSKSSCPDKFKQLSSDVLKKCGGVPLAIIAFASVLADVPSDKWHALLKSIGHGLTNEFWENMQMVISFSYSDLPPHLKTCLLYLCAFPGTHVIERYRLVKKWIAEGIVTQKTKLDQELSLEEVASKYLDELVNRNVIHPLEYNNNGEVITYHIHPMMRDTLKVIAMDEKFAASFDVKDISGPRRMNFRHLCIDTPDSDNPIDLSSMVFDGGVHSLTVVGHAKQFVLRHFIGTRVLDLEGCKSIEKADLEWICSMVLLKQLCLAKTQITDLPPEIGNLQYLEGLDVGGTQITQLPPQIVKLQRLNTLDARKSGVKDLPDEVVQLTRLVHLLIGDNESCEGVKLPDGFGKMTSLEQLGTIDLRKCQASSLKELVELPYLKEIAVLLSNEPEDTRMNDALLSSLRSTGLRSLVVCSDFRLSTLQSSSTYNLICWKKLTVVRRFLKVPISIAEQIFPGMVDISVCKLEEDDLNILRELPRLQSLILRLAIVPTKMIRISCEGFPNLESLYVDCRMPRVIFEEGAMPKLEHLEFKLYGGTANEQHMGIKHLLNLQKVTLQYSKWYATNKGVRETIVAVKTEAKEHQNEITLCTIEEDKDDKCTMKTEIFQENKDISCSKMTEIEEEANGHADGTGYFLNGDDTHEAELHQSNHAIASCSGTSEIEEVV